MRRVALLITALALLGGCGGGEGDGDEWIADGCADRLGVENVTLVAECILEVRRSLASE